MNIKDILDDQEYTISQSSEFLKITSQTVSNYLRNGNLKGIKKGPKNKWFISGSEIKRLMKEWKLI
jgi:predicted site-specific integrase-resolvase